ncbi:hypothetical protein R1sor_003634 [Riccia sorocarpa]|uniref:Inositol polyphosphate multikinase n=1 Tax=Riccia sorocarpa TaxID=122646 RepID=A0ABD3H525_9MARC
MEAESVGVVGFDEDGKVNSTAKTIPADGPSVDGLVLKPAVHQVAGHGQYDGRPGPLVDESGRTFFKPLKEGDYRADREIDFYGKIHQDETVPSSVKKFFPSFYGTKNLPSVDGKGVIFVLIWFLYEFSVLCSLTNTERHGAMENLTYGFKHPSVVDIKIGYSNGYPEASEAYNKKCIVKDQKTTSGAIGFRISGMQIYDVSIGMTWRSERKLLKSMSVDMIRPCMERYVSSNPFSDNPDAAFAASVYGGPHGVLAQLRVLEEWFKTQTSYSFKSTSVLIIYQSGDIEAEGEGKRKVAVKLVDFAHTLDGKGIDENFLGGLQSFMGIISSIVEDTTS